MTEQVFQFTTQYKYAVLRVVCFSFLSMIFFAVIFLVTGRIFAGIFTSIFPDKSSDGLMFVLFILLSIALIIFFTKYTDKFGKYEVTLKIGSEAMTIVSMSGEYNEKIYLWSDLREFRLITSPPSPGFDGVIYIKWRDGDSNHFSGQDLDKFYHFLELNFPKKEWRFLGMPKTL